MSIAKTDQRIAKMYLCLSDRRDLSEKVFDEMQLTRKWVLSITGSEWPLANDGYWGVLFVCAIPILMFFRLRQVRALRAIRVRGEEMAAKEKADYLALILSTVTGVSAGLQNTG